MLTTGEQRTAPPRRPSATSVPHHRTGYRRWTSVQAAPERPHRPTSPYNVSAGPALLACVAELSRPKGDFLVASSHERRRFLDTRKQWHTIAFIFLPPFSCQMIYSMAQIHEP